MSNQTTNHSASATVAGFEYQFYRALLHLAHAPLTTMVGIETGDDVEIQHSNGRTLEQDKLTFTEDNPFQNRSFNLWNTFDIWLDKLEESGSQIDHLILASNSTVSADCLAYKIAHSNTSEETEVILGELKQIASTARTVAPIIKRVQSRSDIALKEMIQRVELVDGSDSGSFDSLYTELRTAIRAPSGFEVDVLLDTLQGWIRRVAIEAWRKKEPAWIKAQAFIDAKYNLFRTFERQRRLERPYLEVHISTGDKFNARIRAFVEHLDRVEASQEIVGQAIEECLRFKSEYSRLLREGEIADPAWDAFFNELKERWRPIIERGKRKKGVSQEYAGYDIFDETTQRDYRARIDGEQTSEKYFTSGAYHDLSDRDEVWWHPAYLPNTQKVRRAE